MAFTGKLTKYFLSEFDLELAALTCFSLPTDGDACSPGHVMDVFQGNTEPSERQVLGAACIIPDPSALFPVPSSPLSSSPVTHCHSFCRNQGGGKANERGQMPTTDRSKLLGKLLSKIFPACCLSTSCWESSTCEYIRAVILSQMKAAVFGIAEL